MSLKLRCSNPECESHTNNQHLFNIKSLAVDEDRQPAEELVGIDAENFNCAFCGAEAQTTTGMRRTEILYRKGDATSPEDPSGDRMIIAHVCNDMGGFGAGFALAVARKWPQVAKDYRQLHREHGLQLGLVQMVRVHQRIVVANMVAQHGYKRSPDGVPLDYDALRKCLEGVVKAAIRNDCSIHMPRIGAGLAGGDWFRIADIIKETICDRGLRVTVYDLPKEADKWQSR